MSDAISWKTALRVGTLAAKAGPPATEAELRALVSELHAQAAAAVTYVEEITGLSEAADVAVAGPVYVVDRARFVEANVQIFTRLLGGLLGAPGPAGLGTVAGAEAGAALAFFSQRTLGQFDPFTPRRTGRGRVLLVAPNVLRFERELDANPTDFRLWVCLHEQTHAVQFAAAPWLAGYIEDNLRMILADIPEESELFEGARDLIRALPRILSDRDDQPGSSQSIIAAALGPEQRETLAQLMAVMTLLEGHADVVMDAVGPKVVASVSQIRHRFDARRVSQGRLERTARRLMGLDAKLAQYRDGATFVRSVLSQVGHEGLAAVFAEPANLPTIREIEDPRAWVRRVAG